MLLAMLSLALTMVASTAAAQPVVAVFQIEDATAKSKGEQAKLRQLTDYLSAKIGEGDAFRVVPTARLKKELSEQKNSTYDECYDESCQIEIGKALAAEKSLSTQILHLGKRCILKSTLFDLAQEVSERVATVKSACGDDALVAAVEEAASKLKHELVTAAVVAPPPEDPPPAGKVEEIAEDDLPEVPCFDRISCYALGTHYRDGKNGKPIDVRLARAFLLKGCEFGSGFACSDLGFIYEHGKDAPKDPLRASKLYRRACELGSAAGCTNTGFMFERGIGVEQSAQLAVRFYDKGCKAGHGRGCTNLGYMFRNGKGVARDESRARALYRDGCNSGDAGGCTNLGYLFEMGRGVRSDYNRAAKLYRRGCDAGNAVGCSNLGSLYERGRGVQSSITLALEYYRRGCDAGNKLGCSHVERLKRSR